MLLDWLIGESLTIDVSFVARCVVLYSSIAFMVGITRSLRG